MDDYREPPNGFLLLNVAVLVVGAVAGAAAALFLAPKSGQELRTRVMGSLVSWREHAAETLVQGRETVIRAVEQGHERLGV